VLLQPNRRGALADALFSASRRWSIALHVNNGLAGATIEAVAAARDTAINPAVLDGFALIMSGAEEPPGYPGIPGHEPDVAAGRRQSEAVVRAMTEIGKLVPSAGSKAESNFCEPAWQQTF
jgi:hypothetical protein